MYVKFFYLIHTYSSDALTQGILKSFFFAFTNFLMPLPRFEPVAPNCPRLMGKHGMHSPNSLTTKKFCLLSDQDSELAGSVSLLIVNKKEGRKEIFYLTTHSTHCIYDYMASDIW